MEMQIQPKNEREKPENTKYRQDKPLRNDHSSVNNYSRFEVFAFLSLSLFIPLSLSLYFFP